MILTIKLTQATYTMRMESTCMTVDCTTMSEATAEKPSKQMVSILGYYGPAQVDKAVARIIDEEVTRDQATVNLREFLIRYKAIHETLAPILAELKSAVKENRLETV